LGFFWTIIDNRFLPETPPSLDFSRFSATSPILTNFKLNLDVGDILIYVRGYKLVKAGPELTKNKKPQILSSVA
ncbi:MAG: hypothetical protein ACPLTR_10660, partial [Thermacetogeniaceae bacterium]